ncbi:MAG TPA: hypothetical protein VJM33_05865 [Microthrixaceae bacterium]|nr:hypothetical protein [Microthrixaceae bacterium]
MGPFGTTGHGLKFRLARTPVTIEWTFLLLLGFYVFAGARPAGYGLVFGVVVLVSIVAHEFGHALAFRAYGHESTVSIHGLGGLTMSRGGRELRDTDEIVISLAGPAAGVAIGLVALALQRTDIGDQHLAIEVALNDLVWVNLAWGLVNLVPVLPLDGGMVMDRLVHRASPRNGDLLAPAISAAVAAPLGVWAFLEGFPFAAIIAAFFVAMNLRGVTDARTERRLEQQTRAADEALGLLRSPHPDRAIVELERVLAATTAPDIWDRVALGLAWARAWRGAPDDPDRVAQLVSALHGRHDTALLSAWTARCAGREPEQLAFLSRGFAHDHTEPPLWYVERMLPGRDAVLDLIGWIDQLDLADRHDGLGRLAVSLERSGRPADATVVRQVMARPVSMPIT